MTRHRAGKAVGSSRRSSSRIQKLRDDEALRRTEEESRPQREENVVRKKRRVYAGRRRRQEEVQPVQVSVASSSTSHLDIHYAPHGNVDPKYLPTNIQYGPDEKTPHQIVRECIRTFNKKFLLSVKEERERCGTNEEDEVIPSKRKSSKRPRSKTSPRGVRVRKHKAMRPDLKTVTKMTNENEILKLNRQKFGSIPGIDVGHQFFSRAEMNIVGFHNHWINGIDFIGKSSRKEYIGLNLPLTRSIVLSGQYEDDLDNSESIIYTGQGGHDLLGNKRQIKDQEMKRGNLGLKNCMEQCVPVRVVRGHKCKNSYVNRVYTYDGLYKVDKYWEGRGVSGFIVYKFGLSRLEGQPELTTNQVQFIGGHRSLSVSTLRGLVCEDISGGQEDIPIPASNLVDEPPVPPTGFTYSRNIQVAKNVKIPSSAEGCNCIGGCIDPRTCSCAKLNGSDFPYVVHSKCGRLVEPKAVVFECGPNCGCGPQCINRITQNGFNYRLEVFRTPKKGWGVRSWDFIPSGSPVCEYKGVLKKTDDLDPSSDNNYIFDIDCLQTMKGLDGREKRLRDVTLASDMNISDEDHMSDSQPEFCIDAGSVGNVSRFINHCCQPNLFVQCVLSDHHDIKMARIVLFAADNIPPLQELTYDYGYALDSLVGPDGEVKKMPCYCGADECRKRLI